MTLSCSNDVNASLRKQHKNQIVLDRNKRKLSLENSGMEKGGDFHLQLYSSSPAPKRDYHGLTISSSEIILNSWDISRGTHVYPRRKRISLEDFLIDKWLRSEIEFLFGNHVIIYIDRLAKKERSIFCLSEKIIRKIIDYLAVNDILHLKQSSKIFFELCNTNEIWKILFRKIQKRPPTAAEIKQSELGLTWCHLLQTRVNDIHERKTIFQKYKKGVEALHRQNHEIGDRIRNTVKKQSSDKWRRPESDSINENLLPNQIKIPTYNEIDAPPSRSASSVVSTSSRSASSIVNVKVEEKCKSTGTAIKKTDVKPISNTQSLLKKRVESKKSIETINEMKKVTRTQTGKTSSVKTRTDITITKTDKTKNSELKFNKKPTKITKNNENLKSKSFIT